MFTLPKDHPFLLTAVEPLQRVLELLEDDNRAKLEGSQVPEYLLEESWSLEVMTELATCKHA